jgi:hypothetical protein
MKIKRRRIKLCACGEWKKTCAKHSPMNFCNCGKLIVNCEKCKPHIGRCQCGKRRGMCHIHGGWQLCSCGSGHHASRCTKCGSGGKLCEHKHRINNCMTCLRENQKNGVESQYLSIKSEVCPCGKARKHCSKTSCHGGSHLCVTCKLTVTRTKQTDCSVCRRFKNGKEPMKKKERALKSFLDTHIEKGVIPNYTLYDKVIEPGLEKSLYGSNRPDFLWKLFDRWVVVECDELQHRGHSYSCEKRRELEISNCCGELPIVFIRYNPDTFSTGSKSSRVKAFDESVAKRHEAVLTTLKNAFAEVNPSGLKFVKLFYDCKCVVGCGYTHMNVYADHEAFCKAHT